MYPPTHGSSLTSQRGGAIRLSEIGTVSSQLTIDGAEVRGNAAEEGGGLYVSQGQLNLDEVFFADNVNGAGEASDYDGGVGFSCPGSSCSAGSYGACTPLAGFSACPSCELDVCLQCPAGTASATSNSITADDCWPCSSGNYSEHAGAAQCDGPCAAGHYVTNDAIDTDGFGVTSGGTSCNAWYVLYPV